MPTYGMGDAIREMRIRLGYTQEELAYGICTPGTLSRIENGRAVISKRVFEALCSRIPELHHVWIACDTKTEMQRSKLCKQILHCLEFRRMEEAKDKMQRYSMLKDEKNPFCMQFMYYTWAVYQAIRKEREEEVLPLLQKALQITMPDYKERLGRQKKASVLTYDEVYILSNMGIAQMKQQNNMKKADFLLEYLENYFDKRELETSESMKACPMILGNRAWLFECQGRFEEAVKYCESGMEICRFTGRYTVLPYLLCVKARCFTASGSLKMAENCKRQAKAILDVTEEYRGYGCFEEFYEAREPIYVTF